MNFCSKCGNKFEKENVFCSKCGFKLDVKNESILGLKTAKETSAKLSKNKGNFIDQKTQQNKKTEERKKELEDFITRFSGNQKINIDDTEEFLEDSIQKPNKNIFETKKVMKLSKKLKILATFLLPFIYSFWEAFKLPPFDSNFILRITSQLTAALGGVISISLISCLIASLSFIHDKKGKSFWDAAFAFSLVLTILGIIMKIWYGD